MDAIIRHHNPSHHMIPARLGSRTGWLVCSALCLPLAVTAQGECGLAPLSTHALSYCVLGEGSPTIVLAAGARLSSQTWRGLLPALRGMGTVVTFDRAGLGQSEAGPQPRTPTRIARELHELLRLVHVPRPYLLVGHSAGGHHVLRFAEEFPEDVQAVILVDTPPPDFESRRLDILTPAERDERERILAQGVVGVPDAVRLEREGARRESAEYNRFPRSVPLVVVPANRQNFGSLGDPARQRTLWVQLSHRWLELSDHARIVVAEGSGHMVHHEQPALVLGVIREVIRGR